MKEFFYGIICMVVFTGCHAQPVTDPFSEIYTKTGVYGKEPDAFCLTANQASLAKMKVSSGGIYVETPYMLKELSLYSAVWAFPLKSGTLGLSGRFYGNQDLHYGRLGIAYGRKLSPVLNLGGQINVTRTGITGYGQVQTVTAGLGAILNISDKLVTGVQLMNLGTGIFKKGANKMPALICGMGIGYETSDKLLLQCDISKEENMPVLLIPAIQYNIKKQVIIRLAIISESGVIVAGTGLQWRNIRADLSASYHARLGVTPGLLVMLVPSNQN